MLTYLLKSGVCLAVFYLFYKLLLEKEPIHIFKRIYLLGGLILAFVIPLITFTTLVEIEPMVFDPSIYAAIDIDPQTILEAGVAPINYWPIVLWTIYAFGLVLFGLKFLFNLLHIGTKVRKNPKQKVKQFTHVLLENLSTPHTFFHYIFLNKQRYLTHEIPQEVFWHEETHAKQQHSFDVVLVEILQVVFWFNPLLYFIKKDIKLNHEFLADRAVLNKGVSLTAYQEILLAFSSNQTEPQLANALNYSSIKKRFTIMKTKTSKKAVWIKSLILLPLVVVLVYSFSEQKIVEIEKNTDTLTQEINTYSEINNVDIYINKQNELLVNEVITGINSLQKRLNEINPNLSFEHREGILANVYTNENTKKGIVTDITTILRNYGVRKMNIDGFSKNIIISNWQIIPKPKKDNIAFSEGVTEAMMEEYRAYLNSLDVKHRIIRLDEYKRNEGIYKLMTEKQQVSVGKLPKTLFYDIPKTTIRKMTPDQFEKFKDENIYALWIDGQHVANNVLNNYKYSDFKHYGGSIVKKNARTKKHPQPNQYWLYTPQGFEKAFVTSVYDRYKKSNVDYEAIRTKDPHFKDRSKEKQLQLLLQYNSMEALYKRLFNKHQKLVKRPVHPQHPYVKLERDGKTTYHLKGEVPPPSPPKHDEVKEIVSPNNELQKLVMEYNRIKAKQKANQNNGNSKNLKSQLKSLENRINKELRNADKNYQEKATPAEIKEYNKLAKHYNAVSKNNMVFKIKDVERLEFIYNKMTQEQKKVAESFPDFPPPPPAPPIKNSLEEIIEVPIRNPPPPPIPEDATPEEKARMLKVIKKYAKENPDKVYKHEDKNGKLVEIVEMPVVQGHQTNDLKKYKEKYLQFEKIKNKGKHYIYKSRKEQGELESLFSELGGMYFRLSKLDKNSVKRPTHPIIPYVKLVKDGKEYYKKRNELTEEDKKLLPPPPPPPTMSQKTIEKSSKELQEAFKKFSEAAKLYGASAKKHGNGKMKLTDLENQYKKVMELHKEYSKLATKEGVLPPPPPPSPITIPNPTDVMIKMAKKGALFYYDDKKISSDKAIEITKKNKGLNIQVLGYDSSKPVIKLSKKPITAEE